MNDIQFLQSILTSAYPALRKPETMTFYATFAISGPLKNRYAVIKTDSEITARKYLKFHFPHDWAGIYRENEFKPQITKYGLLYAFTVDLSSLNVDAEHEPHPMLKEAE